MTAGMPRWRPRAAPRNTPTGTTTSGRTRPSSSRTARTAWTWSPGSSPARSGRNGGSARWPPSRRTPSTSRRPPARSRSSSWNPPAASRSHPGQDLGGEGLRGPPVGGSHGRRGAGVGGHVVDDLQDVAPHPDHHGVAAGVPVGAVPEALDRLTGRRVERVVRPAGDDRQRGPLIAGQGHRDAAARGEDALLVVAAFAGRCLVVLAVAVD